MSLERDAKNQEKLDEPRGIVIQLTKDHLQDQDDQFEEGQEEDGSYTEEQLARWYEQAEYVEMSTEYYDESCDPDQEFTKQEWQQLLNSWDDSFDGPIPPQTTIAAQRKCGGRPQCSSTTGSARQSRCQRVHAESTSGNYQSIATNNDTTFAVDACVANTNCKNKLSTSRYPQLLIFL